MVLIALIAVAFWVSANITRPLEKLTMLVKEIRSGHLPEKTQIASPDEVGELADAVNDIVDDLNRTRERVSQLETVRRDFFSNVSHKLNAPLVYIQDMLKTLRDQKGIDSHSRNEIMNEALTQLRSLERLIHTLIEISKIEFGEAELELKELRLCDFIQTACESFKSEASRKGLSLNVEIPLNLQRTMVLGDEGLLSLALGHLISNGIEFTEQGSVIISCSDEDSLVRITVGDSGPGIPLDKLERIFERLYRANISARREMDHAGLGLAITRHIIDAHKQKLNAESKLGIGSKFSFTVEKAKPAQ